MFVFFFFCAMSFPCWFERNSITTGSTLFLFFFFSRLLKPMGVYVAANMHLYGTHAQMSPGG